MRGRAQALVVVGIGATLATGCGADDRTDGPASLALTVERITRLGGTGGVAAGFGSVWAADPAGRVLRLDPSTGAIRARISVPNEGIVTAGAGGVWLPDFGAHRVRRIDPASNRVTASIPARPGPAFVTAHGRDVWVSLHHGNRVDRIDATSDQVTARIRASRLNLDRGGPQGVAVAAGRVWTGIPVLEQLIPLDPRTGRAGKPVATTQEPCGPLVAHGTDLWVSPGQCGFRLMHVDARRGRQVGEHELALASVGDPVVVGRSVWVTTADGVLHELDVHSGRELARGRLGMDLPSIAPAGRGTWFAAGEDVVRITTGTR